MSEYQYYEFQAIDRSLTREEMGQLRSCSSRATITPSRFVNTYNYGDLRGDPAVWMEKYFDVHLYLANWGTHVLDFRFPAAVLPLEVVKPYCQGDCASVRKKGGFVILDLVSDEQEGGWVDDEEAESSLAPILPVRSELMRGDRRALYLAWLLCVQAEQVDEDALEPDCPPGLADLSAPLEAFAQFLRIDPDLLAVAAAGSPRAPAPPSREAVERWVLTLAEPRRLSLLARVAMGEGLGVESELAREFLEATASPGPSRKPRTVRELVEAAGRIEEERTERERQAEAAVQAERERQEAAARETHLNELAKDEAKAWHRVDVLIVMKQPSRYDEAVRLLIDLRDLARREGREQLAVERIERLARIHAAKHSFVDRLVKSGLVSR